MSLPQPLAMEPSGMAPALAQIRQLEQIRALKDWSYQRLGDEIFLTTTYRRDQACWRRICQGETTDPQPRTLRVIALFLEAWTMKESR